MNYQNICLQTVELCKNIGIYLRKENLRLNQSDVESKGKNNFVTYVDKESEKMLVEELKKILPGAGFLTEEGSVEFQDEECYWVIDPLDGTTNYIHQLPPYAISVGLMKNNEVILGCVYEVTLDETYYAWKGGKAWLNGKEITVSKKPVLDNSMIGYGIPYNIEPAYEYLRKKISGLYGKCALRHLGSAATEICYVAAGRLDAYFHDNLSPWDVAAGAIILQEAGGSITDLSGKGDYIFGKEMIATNHFIHKELLDFLTT